MPYLGNTGAIGLGEESTWGTAVSRTVWLRATQLGIRRSVKNNRIPYLDQGGSSANPGHRGHYVESDMVEGRFSFLPMYRGSGMVFKHLFGTLGTTGSDPYTHTYSLARALPTGLTLEVLRGDGDGEVFEGCKLSEATFSLSTGGLLTADVSVIGQTSGGLVSAGSPTFTATDYPVIHHHAGASLTFDGSTYNAKSMSLRMTHALVRRPLLGSKVTAEPVRGGRAEFELTAELEYDASTLHADLLAGTQGDITITFTQPTTSETMAFTVQNAFLDGADETPINGPGVITTRAKFLAESDGTDDGLKCVIVNNQSSGIAA